jgi:prepilin-type N-terminal cleavage/methylation domain-containing protein
MWNYTMVDKQTKNKTKQKGFTIVELMIAASVFSVAIIMVSAVIMGISKTYQKASYTTQLNDASRNFHQELKNSANQGSNISQVTGGTTTWICAGTTVYYWKLSQDTTYNGGLYKLENKTICPEHTSPPTGGINLLPDGAYVYSAGLDSASTKTATTSFGTGTPDMHEEGKLQNACLPTLKGGDFCAQVTYKSTIGNIRQ